MMPLRLATRFALVMAAAAPACAPLMPVSAPAPDAAAFEALVADTSFDHAHWGIDVRALDTGEPVFTHQAEKLFLPASNVKILTGAAALTALGADFRFRTEVLAAGPVRDSTLHGALVIRGAGDPTMSTRFFDDARAPLREWADSLRARGINTVAGPIVGVDSAFVGPPHGSGWAWEDLETTYGAEFGALQFNEGVLDVRVIPGSEVGSPAVIVLEPPTGYAPIINTVATTAAGTPLRLDADRDPAGPTLRFSGQIPVDTIGVLRTVPVRGPTEYFLSVLRETLRAEGISVQGEALDADDWPTEGAPPPIPDRLLFTHASPPLAEVLPAMMLPSQNWIAESLLRALGAELRGDGSARGGVAVVDSLLTVWGVGPAPMRMVDGSGLSRYNLLSPALLAGVLRHMASAPDAGVWLASLPLAGRTGTLAGRMTRPPLLENVRAKTGTLSNIRALSGYVDAAGGRRLVFSILLNHHRLSVADADRLMEAALAAVASRP